MEPGDLLVNRRPVPLDGLQLSPDRRVIVLAPHPDDFDAIGVTLKRLQAYGNPIDLAVVTSGASGVEDEFSGGPDTAVKAAIREQEQRASCRFFGLPEGHLEFLRLEENVSGHPVESEMNIGLIREYILHKRPHIVFLPHWNDTNLGHQRTYAVFRKIVLAEGLSLLACLNQDPKTIEFRTDLYVGFDDEEAEWKKKLLRFHQSQQQRNLNVRGYGLDERILRMNRGAAQALGCDRLYAEAFEIETYGAGLPGEIQVSPETLIE